MNCLECCLHQWLLMPNFQLWYNSNHVVIIEPVIDITDKGYLPLEHFGEDHFLTSFALDQDFREILHKYFAKHDESH